MMSAKCTISENGEKLQIRWHMATKPFWSNERFEGVDLNIGQVCRTVTDGEKESQCCGIFLVVKKRMVINSDHIPLQLVY